MTHEANYDGEHVEDRGEPHAHVRIFGEEVGRDEDARARRRARWEWHMEHGRGRGGGHMVFGLIILFFGVVLFLNALGLLPQGFWHSIVPFWPALLILWGVSVILGRHWLSRLFVLLLALALIFIVVMYGITSRSNPLDEMRLAPGNGSAGPADGTPLNQ